MSFPIRRLLVCCCFFLLYAGTQVQAQVVTKFQEVKGLPTYEIFDLLVDSKGFLWVGHDMGISRFDGVAFTHFEHPQRSSLSMTDLVEDAQGRIWAHNFTGQIFYIENERIQLLESYQYEKENKFPRMVRCGNEIVVTCTRGLFVCDTRTLRGRYVASKNKPEQDLHSLTCMGKQVLAKNLDHWFLYDSATGLRQISLENEIALDRSKRNLVLQPHSYQDTGFLIANPSGTVYKLTLHHGKLILSGTLNTDNFINNVTVDQGCYWVHGRNVSKSGNQKGVVPGVTGYNISDLVTDKQGNKWISTLNKGLLVEPVQAQVQKFSFSFLAADDLVMAQESIGDTLVVGTQKGVLYKYLPKTRKLLWSGKLPRDMGSITFITRETNGQMLVSTSTGTFIYYPFQNQIISYLGYNTKDALVRDNNAIIASATGLYSFSLQLPANRTFKKNLLNLEEWNSWWHRFRENKEQDALENYYWFEQRSRSVAAVEGSGELLVSFMNGVYMLGGKKVTPLLFQNRKVYSNSMVSHQGKIYIGTINNGLLIKKGSELQQLNLEQQLFSNSILRLKKASNFLWILEDRGIQLLDLRTDRIIDNIELPLEPGSGVYDIAQVGDTAFMATHSGMYKVVLKPSVSYRRLQSFLKMVVANRQDTIVGAQATLTHLQNDLQFFLSIPWYNPSNSIYFKYRLKGSASHDHWYATLPGERSIRFASLMPGAYTFEAYAVVAGFQERQVKVFSFAIKKPWWQTHLFFVALILAAAFIFWSLYRMRLRQVLQLDQVRRSISSDLHDEIGSTISSINIYSELAKSDPVNEGYLNLIQENTQDVITKLDDLVWSINPKNDSLAQLMVRMRSFAEPVLIGAGIQPHFELNEALAQVELPLEIKRNLYLIYKELINNVVKHSHAANCRISLDLIQNQLVLVVADDGVGIGSKNEYKGRSGMNNLSERALQIKAVFTIGEGAPGGTRAVLRLPLK